MTFDADMQFLLAHVTLTELGTVLSIFVAGLGLGALGGWRLARRGLEAAAATEAGRRGRASAGRSRS